MVGNDKSILAFLYGYKKLIVQTDTYLDYWDCDKDDLFLKRYIIEKITGKKIYEYSFLIKKK